MSLEKFETDLAKIKEQILQCGAQYHMLVGQQTALEHVINELKAPKEDVASQAPVEAEETVN